MTRKHYRAIASILAKHRQDLTYEPEYCRKVNVVRLLDNTIDQLCPVLAGDNPAFNPDTFRQACNVKGPQS